MSQELEQCTITCIAPSKTFSLAGLSSSVVIIPNEKIPKIKPVYSESTYLVWLNCSELGLKGRELMDFFVNEAKVGINSGITFGKKYGKFVRLNIGCPRTILEEGLNRIENAVKDMGTANCVKTIKHK